MKEYGYDSGYEEGRNYNDSFENDRDDNSNLEDGDEYYHHYCYYDDEGNEDGDEYDEDERYYREDRYDEDDRYDREGWVEDEIYQDDIYKPNRENRQQSDDTQTRLLDYNTMCRRDNNTLLDEIREFVGESILLTLRPNQLNVLGQVFRPIFIGNLVEVGKNYILLKNVNIKMSNAPEYIFPTPLMIPSNQIVWFSPFDSEKRFPLY